MKVKRKYTISGVKLKPDRTKSGTVVSDVSGVKKRLAIARCMRTPIKRHLLQTASFRHAVACSIAVTKKNGNPVARYDIQRKQAYLEYPDGKKTYVE